MNSTLNNILWLISLTAGFAAVVLFSYLDEQFGLGLLGRFMNILINTVFPYIVLGSLFGDLEASGRKVGGGKQACTEGGKKTSQKTF